MANITDIVDSVIAKVNTHTTDITDIKESSLSKVASNVLLSGNLALASSAVTKSNANITYTGNGSTQSITTGIASVDFTVASNGSGYYHDRSAGDCIVKNDAGTIIESGSAVVNVSKVHIKSRNAAEYHGVYDGLRGQSKWITTNSTNTEGNITDALSSFNINGISLGSYVGNNRLNDTYILHQTLYTHIKWGLTNQGKRYITAYNPVTREVMTMYQGSGIAGHQIPNPLGIKLDYLEVKNLNSAQNWIAQFSVGMNSASGDYTNLNSLVAVTNAGETVIGTDFKDDYTSIGNTVSYNENNDTHISYGFANSETKIITQYQGTGASGNFVETKDVNGVARRPARVIIKAVSAVGSWAIADYARGDMSQYQVSPVLCLDSSATENAVVDRNIQVSSTGLILNYSNLVGKDSINASGVQYIAIVEFDTTNNNDDTYFDLPTDDTNLNVTAGKLPYTDGRNATNGAYNVFTQSYTGSVDFSTCPDGIHYVALDSNNAPKFYEKVAIGSYEKEAADDNRLVFNTEDGKWYTTTGGELVTNGTFDSDISGWIHGGDTANGTLTVENGRLKLSQTNNVTYAYQNLSFEIGKKYKISLMLGGGNYASYWLFGSRIESITSAMPYVLHEYEFIAEEATTQLKVQIDANGHTTTIYADNISVYKVASTLDTALTTPISFIDDKPYQVVSGTPVYRFQTRKDRIRRSS